MSGVLIADFAKVVLTGEPPLITMGYNWYEASELSKNVAFLAESYLGALSSATSILTYNESKDLS